MVYVRFGAPGNHHGNPSFVISLPLRLQRPKLGGKSLLPGAPHPLPRGFSRRVAGYAVCVCVSDTLPAQLGVQKKFRPSQSFSVSREHV